MAVAPVILSQTCLLRLRQLIFTSGSGNVSSPPAVIQIPGNVFTCGQTALDPLVLSADIGAVLWNGNGVMAS